MLEILKQQYRSGNALTQAKHFPAFNRTNFATWYKEIHPLNGDYYHEFNPFYVGNVYTPDLYSVARTMTVRDGYVSFADWLLKNANRLVKLNTLFIIHPDLAALIPSNQREHFLSWKISHPKKMSLPEAKRIIIFGLLCDDYLGADEEIAERLAPLAKTSPDAQIQVFLPLRRNPFSLEIKETIIGLTIMSHIKDMFPGRKIDVLDHQSFQSITDMSESFVFDLRKDLKVTADSYIHHQVINRAGSVNLVHHEMPTDSLFRLALGLFHQLHICPLPEVESKFLDLLFYRKQMPGADLLTDPGFQHLVAESLQKN
jgi:hypothetical protein